MTARRSGLMTLGQIAFALAMQGCAAVFLGLALAPAFLLYQAVGGAAGSLPGWLRVLALCHALSAGYFVFGFTLMALAALARFALGLSLKEGTYPMFSAGAIRWAMANALQLLVWTTFGDFILLTPFAALFYRLMGARVGSNVQINSKFCADLSLLEIGDGSVIGGHATVIGHSFERRGLVLKKVVIGKQAVIGLNSIILPGCEIGEGAVVAAGAVVPKYTRVQPGAIFMGRDHEVNRQASPPSRGE